MLKRTVYLKDGSGEVLVMTMIMAMALHKIRKSQQQAMVARISDL